ncbi:hypothetical protein FHR83_003586 [Actinoplanes campanulatus]|uniref:Uncharacterized protein n=1 Tax=Actinoplanes campanulatus TaxID=113559 RepID=A0A7W5AH21_9ACTN|nr:hypothetical protein [Actinoplanes campanulatus]MBB3095916.1 hypothetical protein [Actinoplanes campanulatus]GGN12407.1 hypothetical protein GCM10010109_22990 [Actinoplanes campanulatus]GID36989.1 hypothetical protein Aca09nite_34950 [Actinoplanes campanulatus]
MKITTTDAHMTIVSVTPPSVLMAEGRWRNQRTAGRFVKPGSAAVAAVNRATRRHPAKTLMIPH